MNYLKGLLFSTNDCLNQPMDLIRLWLHEAQRVYGDKLIEEKDLDAFTKFQLDVLKKNFEVCDYFIIMKFNQSQG